MATTTASSSIFDSTSDLDLANILYIHSVPIEPENDQAGLQANINSINQWLAWDLTRIESQVQDKVDTKQLPSDNSIISKSKRTAYRMKVMDAYDSQSPWLVTGGISQENVKIAATKDKIGIAILHAILNSGQNLKDQRILNLLKALGIGFADAGTPNTVQPHRLYIIDHQIDPVTGAYGAVIKTLTFNVTVTAESPAPMAKSTSAAKSATENYQAVIAYTSGSMNFVFNLWNGNAPSNESAYSLGKAILPQRLFVLLKDAGAS